MKNAASFAARILTAIAIAAVVAFAQYWIWQQLNRSTEFIGTNQSIKGFAYNGFQRRIKGIAYDTDALAHVLLAHLEGEAGASEVPRDALPQRAPRARDTPDTEELGRVRASLVEVS